MTVKFCSIIDSWLQTNVPRCGRQASPTWSTPLLRSLRRQKNACQRLLRRSRTRTSQRLFHEASTAYRRLNASLYKSHVLRVQANLRSNPRSFWTFVNSKRKGSGTPTNVYLDNAASKSNSEACELFARHFASVFAHSSASIAECTLAMPSVPADVMDLGTFHISANAVEKSASKLKNSFRPGPDGIPAVIFRRCIRSLAQPLARIFNDSFAQQKFPDIWKKTIMFPIHKKGDRRNVINYRGITNLSAGSKLFEIIVNEVLLQHSKQYIAPNQHGFVPGRSVCSNLVEYTSYCISQIEQKAQVDAVYTDIKAAFDRIDHNILLAKLSRLSIHRNLIAWFHSYLTERKISIKLGDCVSCSFTNHSGVPQGSNLGPLLFILFFNDVILCLSDGCAVVYADDLKIYVAVRTSADCHRLQTQLNHFDEWCSVNKLLISIAKCSVITFHRSAQSLLFEYSISGSSLLKVDEINDLAVLLDRRLSFQQHYNSVIAKGNRQLGFISKIV